MENIFRPNTIVARTGDIGIDLYFCLFMYVSNLFELTLFTHHIITAMYVRRRLHQRSLHRWIKSNLHVFSAGL
jgi:hypothetical protein